MNRINFLINKNLTGLTIENNLEITIKLRELGIAVQHGSEASKYFHFYTEEEMPIIQWTVSLSSEDISNGFWINGANKKQSIKLISFEDLYSIIKDYVFYAPYGLNYGLSDLKNWKKINIEDFGNKNLYNDYFDWRIEINPEDIRKLEHLRTVFKED